MSILANNTNDPLRWNIERLKEFRNNLVKSGELNEDELSVIDCLIQDDTSIMSALQEKVEFNKLYADEVKTIHLDYYPYLAPILDFVENNCDKGCTVEPLDKISLTHAEIMDLIYDFYNELDSNWFSIVNRLYTDDNNYIAVSNNPSFSMYANKANTWLCNINGNGTIRECSDIAHEFGHGIQDIMSGKKLIYGPETVLMEMFPMLMQTLFIDYLRRNGIEVDQCNLELLTTFNSMLNEAAALTTKMQITAELPNVSNSRNLRRIIKRELDMDFSSEDLENLFSVSSKREIHYVLPYTVVSNLYKLYKEDRELFIRNVNQLLNNQENMVDIARELKMM